MTSRMLIDVRHPEETRVAVVRDGKVDEFDFEAALRKQIKGNIYLAKITRVEPSLQAAFVDYGGNRHGFLAFSEIHPDYYQIPQEDREALLKEEQALAEEHSALEDSEAEQDEAAPADGDAAPAGEGHDEGHSDGNSDGSRDENRDEGRDETPVEALRRRRMALRRRYKIQEVIRRRQVMLVQVVKEERGNKGAALTTYLSLAGRYSVLMPNTAHGGGISRKIVNAADRKRLKAIIAEIALPSSMGAIIRTAGVARTRAEIRRDFTYLTKLWDSIREKTLQSSAPALIYEDNALVKRAIRDIYTRDIDEILVDGEEGHKQARAFMKLMMPSHMRKVKLYSDPVPLFQRAGIESQLAALIDPIVHLKSGGYLVINPTEALVSVDVNSGRANREHSIEDTALKTNIEAAEELARQLRLRDMAGLIVIDFIDMEQHGNNRRVERALKEALKRDHARIQVGHISGFGLLEMSRQRLRTGVLEATTVPCPTCAGAGIVPTESAVALQALRLLEDEIVKGRASRFTLHTGTSAAVYILNHKRAAITALEGRYNVRIEIMADSTATGAPLSVDADGPRPEGAENFGKMTSLPPIEGGADIEDADDIEDDDDARDAEPSAKDDSARDGGARDDDARSDERGRRRRRRKPADSGRASPRTAKPDSGEEAGNDNSAGNAAADGDSSDETADSEKGRDSAGRGRRRRRGSGRGSKSDATPETADAARAGDDGQATAPTTAPTATDEAGGDKKPRRRRRARSATVAAKEGAADTASEAVTEPAPAAETPPAPAARIEPPAPAAAPAVAEALAAAESPVPISAPAADPAPAAPQEASQSGADEESAPPRRGWWQRTFGG